MKIHKPGIRDVNVGKKIRIWKRADCACPGFVKGEEYLYVGHDGPKFLVDHNSIVLKWERKLFKDYVKFLGKKAGCEVISRR